MATNPVIPTDPTAPSAVVNNPVTPSAEPSAPPAVQPGSPAVPPTASSAPGSQPGAPPVTDNVRQLREQYETIKARLEGYTKLGEPDSVTQQVQQFQNWQKESQTLAGSLNYDPATVEAAFKKDPVGTLSALRNEYQTAKAAAEKANTPDGSDPKKLQDYIKKQIQDGTKPLNQFLEQQMETAAFGRFDKAFDSVFSAAFPDADTPKEVRDALYELTDAMIGYDEEAMKRLKYDGKTADVNKYFDQAKSKLLTAVNAYGAWQTKKAGAMNNRPNQPEVKPAFPQGKSKLDAMIENPALINPKYA